jgi:hypothetical protein
MNIPRFTAAASLYNPTMARNLRVIARSRDV